MLLMQIIFSNDIIRAPVTIPYLLISKVIHGKLHYLKESNDVTQVTNTGVSM